jgi:excisionase family DNA binding protein
LIICFNLIWKMETTKQSRFIWTKVHRPVDASGSFGGDSMDDSAVFIRPIVCAKRLSVSRAKIYEMVASGDLPSCRIGGAIRIPAKALVQLEQETLAKGRLRTE